MPKMHLVESTMIESVGHDDEADELYIRFNAGSIYVFPGVGREVFEALLAAGSKGTYFNERIKPFYLGFKRP